MDRNGEIETLKAMLADATRLADAADPLLAGLYGTLQARLRLLISLVEAEDEADDRAA